MDSFEKAAKKMADEEQAAEKAREEMSAKRPNLYAPYTPVPNAAEEHARAVRFPVRYPATAPNTLDEKYAEQDPQGARMDAFRPTVGDPSGKTPAQAAELASIRASDEYTRAHRNYLERARSGERLKGYESSPDGSLEPANPGWYGADETADEDRNDTVLGGFTSQRPALSDVLTGRSDPQFKQLYLREVDNLARREAIEAYEQERAAKARK